jgi:transcriptional regulator GlxA family with amidase domain
MVELSLRQPTKSRAMIGPIFGTIVDLLSHTQGGRLETLARRWRHREAQLSMAERFLRSNLGQPFDCKALAAACGATERSVQKHFLEAYGMTPGQWARCLALHHVRKRLLRPDAARFTVEGIANELGFRHMGRFAGYYMELFGEYPSATLVRL